MSASDEPRINYRSVLDADGESDNSIAFRAAYPLASDEPREVVTCPACGGAMKPNEKFPVLAAVLVEVARLEREQGRNGIVEMQGSQPWHVKRAAWHIIEALRLSAGGA